MRHTHPTTRSHRSPPERPTAHTQAQHTHPQQTSRQRPAHARTAAPPRPSPPTVTAPADTTHPSQPQPRSTNTRRHELNHSSATSTQRSDQRKHQHHATEITTSRNHFPQTAQGIPRGGYGADRFASWEIWLRASLEHESITFAHCWEAVNPRNYVENSVLVCRSAHVRNGRKLPMPWGLSLA